MNRRQLLAGASTFSLVAGTNQAIASDCDWVLEALESITHEERRIGEWISADAPQIVNQLERELTESIKKIDELERAAGAASMALIVNSLAATAAVALALLAVPAVAASVTAATGIAVSGQGLLLAGVAVGTTMFIVRGIFAPESMSARTAGLRIVTDASRVLKQTKNYLVGVMKTTTAFAGTLLSTALAGYRVISAIESGKTYLTLKSEVANLKAQIMQVKTNIDVYREPAQLSVMRTETLAINREFFEQLASECTPSLILP